MTVEPHIGDDRMVDLVNHLLPDEERQQDLAHLRGCTSCAGRLREFAHVHELAHTRAAESLARAAEALSTRSTSWSSSPQLSGPRGIVPPQSVSRSGAHGTSVSRSRSWSGARAALAIAAVLVLMFAGQYAWRASQPDAPLPHSIPWLPVPEPEIFQRDSSSEEIDPRFTEGLLAYRNHDAKVARRLLASARTTGPSEQVRRIYLGSSELQLGDPRAALATLRSVELAQVPDPWRGEAQWALALAYAGTGQASAADSLWRLLSSRPGELGERARRALDGTSDGP